MNALQQLILQRTDTQDDLDRFIPDRSAMDFDYAHYMLTQGRKMIEKTDNIRSTSREAYQKRIAEALNMNQTRILAFKNKRPMSGRDVIRSEMGSQPAKKRRYISQTSERTLDAPEILDDFSLNLLDWGCNKVLAIAHT